MAFYFASRKDSEKVKNQLQVKNAIVADKTAISIRWNKYKHCRLTSQHGKKNIDRLEETNSPIIIASKFNTPLSIKARTNRLRNIKEMRYTYIEKCSPPRPHRTTCSLLEPQRAEKIAFQVTRLCSHSRCKYCSVILSYCITPTLVVSWWLCVCLYIKTVVSYKACFILQATHLRLLFA